MSWTEELWQDEPNITFRKSYDQIKAMRITETWTQTCSDSRVTIPEIKYYPTTQSSPEMNAFSNETLVFRINFFSLERYQYTDPVVGGLKDAAPIPITEERVYKKGTHRSVSSFNSNSRTWDQSYYLYVSPYAKAESFVQPDDNQVITNHTQIVNGEEIEFTVTTKVTFQAEEQDYEGDLDIHQCQFIECFFALFERIRNIVYVEPDNLDYLKGYFFLWFGRPDLFDSPYNLLQKCKTRYNNICKHGLDDFFSDDIRFIVEPEYPDDYFNDFYSDCGIEGGDLKFSNDPEFRSPLNSAYIPYDFQSFDYIEDGSQSQRTVSASWKFSGEKFWEIDEIDQQPLYNFWVDKNKNLYETVAVPQSLEVTKTNENGKPIIFDELDRRPKGEVENSYSMTYLDQALIRVLKNDQVIEERSVTTSPISQASNSFSFQDPEFNTEVNFTRGTPLLLRPFPSDNYYWPAYNTNDRTNGNLSEDGLSRERQVALTHEYTFSTSKNLNEEDEVVSVVVSLYKNGQKIDEKTIESRTSTVSLSTLVTNPFIKSAGLGSNYKDYGFRGLKGGISELITVSLPTQQYSKEQVSYNFSGEIEISNFTQEECFEGTDPENCIESTVPDSTTNISPIELSGDFVIKEGSRRLVGYEYSISSDLHESLEHSDFYPDESLGYRYSSEKDISKNAICKILNKFIFQTRPHNLNPELALLPMFMLSTTTVATNNGNLESRYIDQDMEFILNKVASPKLTVSPSMTQSTFTLGSAPDSDFLLLDSYISEIESAEESVSSKFLMEIGPDTIEPVSLSKDFSIDSQINQEGDLDFGATYTESLSVTGSVSTSFDFYGYIKFRLFADLSNLSFV